jgi:hypothetical protein
MKAKDIGIRIQSVFDWISELLSPVESRWITLSITVFMYLILRAAGAHGVAEIVALIYIMYWVTLRGPRREQD